MDETARKMLPYNKEYELKEGKYPGGTCRKLPQEEHFLVKWDMMM